jgi:ribose-phosphate pyrophosphokinase
VEDIDKPIIFAMDGMTDLAQGIEAWIAENWIEGFKLSTKEEWRRHDREGYTRSLVNLRGRQVYILQSYATDNMRPVFAPCDEPYRVKLTKEYKHLPAGTIGIARREDSPLLKTVSFYYHKELHSIPFTPKLAKEYLQILGETVDEKTWGTFNFIRSLRDSSAERITLVGTMFPEMRQDERDQPHAFLGTVSFPATAAAAKVHRLITMDVHAKAAMQNSCSALDLRFDHLEARGLLVREAIKGIPPGARILVISPDVGATKRSATKFHESAEYMLKRMYGRDFRVGMSQAIKMRSGDTETKILQIIEEPDFPIGPRPGYGPEDGAHVICQDDILATGSTLAHLEHETRKRGGFFHAACFTNGLFTGDAIELLKDMPRLVGTRTCDPWRIAGSEIEKRITWVDTAWVFARAIQETHMNGSINTLLQEIDPKETEAR